ncbi:hypothetical protein DM02DRAFT_354696 [Periconia macrospinosa]|uniref:Uncharacterized protein n=1 Tax=Periconia macrospinosa TaxID=97972 RepID=A0A2V1EAV2_9PLEO|nr:hypothetical protein DM02DRAFT_354696 [Periconia macrospinosa]
MLISFSCARRRSRPAPAAAAENAEEALNRLQQLACLLACFQSSSGRMEVTQVNCETSLQSFPCYPWFKTFDALVFVLGASCTQVSKKVEPNLASNLMLKCTAGHSQHTYIHLDVGVGVWTDEGSKTTLRTCGCATSP